MNYVFIGEREERERERDRLGETVREVYACVCVCLCVPRLKKLRMEMKLIEEQLANQTAKQDVIKSKF